MERVDTACRAELRRLEEALADTEAKHEREKQELKYEYRKNL